MNLLLCYLRLSKSSPAPPMLRAAGRHQAVARRVAISGRLRSAVSTSARAAQRRISGAAASPTLTIGDVSVAIREPASPELVPSGFHTSDSDLPPDVLEHLRCEPPAPGRRTPTANVSVLTSRRGVRRWIMQKDAMGQDMFLVGCALAPALAVAAGGAPHYARRRRPRPAGRPHRRSARWRCCTASSPAARWRLSPSLATRRRPT